MDDTDFTIELPPVKNRNPFAMRGVVRGKTMKDRRERRAKDAKNSWKKEEW